jgi:hypothetical protein
MDAGTSHLVNGDRREPFALATRFPKLLVRIVLNLQSLLKMPVQR